MDFNYSYEARVEVWRKIMEYNSINDLAYDNGKIEYSNFGGAIHFWNKNWDESIVDSVYFELAEGMVTGTQASGPLL